MYVYVDDLHTSSVSDRSSGINTLPKRNCSRYTSQREREREKVCVCVCVAHLMKPIHSSQLTLVSIWSSNMNWR